MAAVKKQRNANARIIYAKFARQRARNERTWQNAKCKMPNAECRWIRPEKVRPSGAKGGWNRGLGGGELETYDMQQIRPIEN